MNKNDQTRQEWWIKLNEVSEGPFSINQLRYDPRVTPDTLVWKKGFEKWIPIREVKELKDLFVDSEEQDLPLNLKRNLGSRGNNELVIDTQKDPFDFFYWLILAVIIISYVLYQLYWI
ncbi:MULTISPECIES: DUF4339 domain-containing protein [Parachlamydia]|uniref:DUF4339 domain-containing protein n=1 Tax=Parachlamydia TaxID=83551 RepID=UPI001D05BD71|nr:DUF4339 domain-containing protein [Parachlamydia acanthamoebae]